MNINCRILSKNEFDRALSIRYAVFVYEQHVPLEEERDEYDDTATHFGAFDQNKMIGTGRVVIKGTKAKIGRLAVLKTYRNLGVGRGLMNAMLAYCYQQNLSEAVLNAQLHSIPFYEKAGFTAQGDVFNEAGIAHRTMCKKLTSVSIKQ